MRTNVRLPNRTVLNRNTLSHFITGFSANTANLTPRIVIVIALGNTSANANLAHRAIGNGSHIPSANRSNPHGSAFRRLYLLPSQYVNAVIPICLLLKIKTTGFRISNGQIFDGTTIDIDESVLGSLIILLTQNGKAGNIMAVSVQGSCELRNTHKSASFEINVVHQFEMFVRIAIIFLIGSQLQQLCFTRN